MSQDQAEMAEKACLHQSDTVFRYGNLDQNDDRLSRSAILLCYELARFNLYELTDSLLEKAPLLLCPQTSHHSMLGLLLNRFPLSIFTHFELLKRMLEAGADPNEHVLYREVSGWTTIWCSFLAFLDLWATRGVKPSDVNVVSSSSNVQSTQGGVVSNTSHTLTFLPHVQTVLRLLLRSGVELEIDVNTSNQDCDRLRCYTHRQYPSAMDARIKPLSILRKWLPMDDGSEWPTLLQAYMQPSKRKELRDERNKVYARLRDSDVGITLD